MSVITVTEKAIKEIKHIMSESNMDSTKVSMRLRVIGGGCSGFSMKLDLDEVFDEGMDVLETIDGIIVAVDKRSLLYCNGAVIDFYDGIDKRGFKIDNPQAKATCGCGSSFSL